MVTYQCTNIILILLDLRFFNLLFPRSIPPSPPPVHLSPSSQPLPLTHFRYHRLNLKSSHVHLLLLYSQPHVRYPNSLHNYNTVQPKFHRECPCDQQPLIVCFPCIYVSKKKSNIQEQHSKTPPKRQPHPLIVQFFLPKNSKQPIKHVF